MTIPARLHFCLIGTSLPWAYVFAVLSAAERSGLSEIVLHHTDLIEDGEALRALKGAPRVCLSPVEPMSFLTQTGQMLGLGDRLALLYRGLASPVIRSDILRVAILYAHGGIYLDLDTVTVASLLPLTGVPQFVGSEFIVWPHFVRISRSPTLWARHLALDLLRKALRKIPHGWQAFRKIERLYSLHVNNAAMGAEANSSLFSSYLHAMLDLSPERQMQRYALGPKLLQEVVQHHRPDDLTIQEPQVFYPLPPEISEHWFRPVRVVRLDEVLSTQTRVVHWYASVRTKPLVAQISPGYVRQHRERQLYSALVCSCIDELPEAA